MKNRKMLALATAALMLASTAGSAFAAGRWNDRDQVRYGIRNGSLSHREVSNIRQNNWEQRRYANRAMRDGHLNSNERRNLRRMEYRNDRYLRNSMRDGH